MKTPSNAARCMSLLAWLGTLAWLVAAPAWSADAEPRTSWSGNARIGLKSDSNVAVLDIDRSAGERDFAGLADLGVAGVWRATERATLRAGYDFSQTFHFEQSDFNLQTHRLSLDAVTGVGSANVGVMAHHVEARLDGDGFLTFRQVSPYVSRLYAQRLFLRGAYVYTRKDFARNPARDSDAHSMSADSFLFLNGLTSYLMFGYRFDNENAAVTHFDFAGHRVSTQWTRRLAAGARQVVARGRLRYERRNYAGVDPAIGEGRLDERYRADVRVEVPLTERVSTTAAYEFADNRSNLPAVDFSKHVLSVTFGVRL